MVLIVRHKIENILLIYLKICRYFQLKSVIRHRVPNSFCYIYINHTTQYTSYDFIRINLLVSEFSQKKLITFINICKFTYFFSNVIHVSNLINWFALIVRNYLNNTFFYIYLKNLNVYFFQSCLAKKK